jgi:hypothetical protein
LDCVFKANGEKMKISTRVVLQMTEKIGEYIPVSEESFEYFGPLALADRWAQGQAKENVDTAGGLMKASQDNALKERAMLNPIYQKEATAEHLYTPGQSNEMLTAALAGGGAAAGDTAAATNRLAAETRNPSGFTKSLQEQARDRDKAAAGASEGIAAQDVMGAKGLNQAGIAGEQGLFNTDTNTQLSAMGAQNAATEAEVKAGQSGWLQNMNSTISALGSAASGAGSLGWKPLK